MKFQANIQVGARLPWHFAMKLGSARVAVLRPLSAMIMAGSLVLLPVERALAKPVRADDAKAAVQGWLRLDSAPFAEPLGRTVQKIDTFTNSQGNIIYYVADLKPSGFVVMPADDVLEPIIAFAARGRYDPSRRNPLGALVNHDIPRRLARVRSSKPSAALVETVSKWQILQQNSSNSPSANTVQREALLRLSDLRVAPLTRTLWNQDTAGNGSACYNYYTPPHWAGDPQNYYCGCTATAMAQLMDFFQWPKAGVGTAAFDISVDGVTRSAYLRGGDGFGGPYAWTSMAADPTNPTVAQCQAIGALTYDAGVAATMAYGSNSSTASVSNMRAALTTTFMFHQVIMGGGSASAASLGSSLLNMVNPNLDARRPVILSIYGPPGGHAVICDGYGYDFGTGYHHINTGWGGLGNIWYALPIVDAAGELFTNVNTCFYNIFLTGSGEIISGRVLDSNGGPIAGATISAARTGGGAYGATTDAHGIYALAGVPSASQYALTASCAGYSPGTRNCSTGTSATDSLTCGNVWGANFTLVATNAAPRIPLQPADGCTVRGATASFTGAAVGAAPLNYFWYKDGARLANMGNVSGSASARLVISNVCAADAGKYSLVVSNGYGSATSTGALLTVYAPGLPSAVTFDDFTNSTAGAAIPAGYGNLTWLNFNHLDAVNTTSRPSGYQVGMISSNNVAFNSYGQPASLTSTGLFSFISAYLTAAWNDGLQLRVEGYNGGQLIYSNSYSLNATARTFIQFNYLGVQEVDFISWGGTLHPGYNHSEPAEQFVLDNAVISTQLQPLWLPALQMPTSDGSTIMLSWNAAAGGRYQVQCTGDLTRPNWNNLGSTLLATNSVGAYSDATLTQTQRFYRIVLVP